MKNAFKLSLSSLLLCLLSSASIAQSSDTDKINQFISRQAAEERGEEYEEARKVVKGDLNRDGVSDLAVLYTIEGQHGTNNYLQYLAVFIRVKGRLRHVTETEVGGKSYRAVELQSIRNRVIFFKVLKDGTNDATNRGGKRRVTRFVLVKRKLKEI